MVILSSFVIVLSVFVVVLSLLVVLWVSYGHFASLCHHFASTYLSFWILALCCFVVILSLFPGCFQCLCGHFACLFVILRPLMCLLSLVADLLLLCVFSIDILQVMPRPPQPLGPLWPIQKPTLASLHPSLRMHWKLTKAAAGTQFRGLLFLACSCESSCLPHEL